MMQFATLLSAHCAGTPAEATLAFAGAAAFCGLQADGQPMHGPAGQPPLLRELADELGLHVGAIRRGVRWLAAAGLVKVSRDGVAVEPAALQARWAARSCVIRLSGDVRALGLRSEPLLVAGVVAGEVDHQGRLVAGLGRWVARTGLPRRTVARALAAADAAGAIHKWTIPGKWLLCCAPGPRRDPAPGTPRDPAPGMAPPAAEPRAARRDPAPEMESGDVATTSRSGTRINPRIGTGGTDPGSVPPLAVLDPEQGTAGTSRTEGTEGGPRAPHHDLRALLLTTRIREGVRRLDPLAHWEFIDRLAAALHAGGMDREAAGELYAIAEARTNKPDGDPTGLFFHLCGGPWRRLLDDRRQRLREAAARRRGAQAAVQAPKRPPQDLGEVLAELLRQVRHG